MPSATTQVRKFLVVTTLAAAVLIGLGCSSSNKSSSPTASAGGSSSGGSSATADLGKINHLIVIYQENWSFDSLYGYFPGANGLANAKDTVKQVDKDGKAYDVLPQPINTSMSPVGPDPRFPANLPVAPFDASKYVPVSDKTGDLVHRYYQEQYQIDGGKMDKFVAWSDASSLSMSYYDATNLPEGKLAQEYTMADNFYHSAFGGSFLNHFYLVCACAPVWPNAPASIVATVDPATGLFIKDGQVTPDGFAVNTSQPLNKPFAASTSDPTLRVPPQTMNNIGDELSAKNVTWAWYSGGWNDANAGKPDPLFQYHHQPFNFFANYADGKPGRAHLQDVTDFLGALKNNSLPSVSFVKPIGADNEHPGYADLQTGQQYTADLVKAVQDSPFWKDTAIIITYDEHGGRWDHVAPPKGDKWGPGTRVPAIIISPYAKKHFVDHTQYETDSILKFIEDRWGVAALGTHDGGAADMSNAFDFKQKVN